MYGNIQVQTRKIDSLLTSIGTPTLYVFSGSISTNTSIFTLSTYASNLLITFGPLVSNSFVRDSSSTTGTRIYMSLYPSNANAVLSGTATWFCLYTNNTNYVLGDISDPNGSGILVLSTTSIVSGTSYGVYSFAFELKQ